MFRAAWYAVGHYAAPKEANSATVEITDLDDILDETELKDVKFKFWKRYKLKHPANMMPVDSMVRRCYREMGKRMPMVCDSLLLSCC